MVQLGELMMILELHRQGLSITAIARRAGRDPRRCANILSAGSRRRFTGRARWAGPASSLRSWSFCASGSFPQVDESAEISNGSVPQRLDLGRRRRARG